MLVVLVEIVVFDELLLALWLRIDTPYIGLIRSRCVFTAHSPFRSLYLLLVLQLLIAPHVNVHP